ncbi:hypothetical protein H4582DRAFT_742780 [Lactarius indigo]|nr:hypothetical protein H4582DRAFT_742780 [Lactarius indigo]
MSNRVPPSFPQPFSAGSSYPARDAPGTPEQRRIDPAQVSAYPPDSVFARSAIGTSLDSPYWPQTPFPVQSHGSTPNLMPILNAPPRRPPPQIPPHRPIQGQIPTPPAFPMPQVPNIHVPDHTITSYPSPPIVQTTHTPGHHSNPQVTPWFHPSYPPQAPVLSHSPLQYESGMSVVGHTAPVVQRNQDDSDDEEYPISQASLVTHDGNMRAKGPPSHVAYGVRDTVRTKSCTTCKQVYPENQTFCPRCNR